MQPLGWLRRVVHRPYWRATAVGLSLALSVCSFGALHLRVRHDVSLAAVVRYFTRAHSDTADLAPLLRNWEAGLQLEALLDTREPGSVGGLVYARGNLLVFHPHGDPGRGRRWRAERENRLLYSRLVPLYHRGAVAELAAQLSSPEVRAALVARGIDCSGLEELEAQRAAVKSEEDETRLLRRMAPFIQPFTPTPLAPSWLDLGDKLRFYERRDPAGAFVGQYTLLDPGWGPRFDEDEARALSRRCHYILVTRVGERILLLDFYRGEVRRYDLQPFDHEAGNRLFQLTVAG